MNDFLYVWPEFESDFLAGHNLSLHAVGLGSSRNLVFGRDTAALSFLTPSVTENVDD